LPPSLVETEFDGMWEQLTKQLEQTGRSFEEEGKTEDGARAEYRKLAERRVRLGLVIGEIGERGNIDVTQDELRRALFRPALQPGRGRGPWRGRGFAETQMPLAETRASALGSGTLSGEDLRVMLILATLCRYPSLVERFETDLDRLAPRHPDHRALADLLLGCQARDTEDVAAQCAAAGLGPALDRLSGMAHLRVAPILGGAPDVGKAAACLSEEFAKYHADRALTSEMAEALEDLERLQDGDARLGLRLNHAVQRRQTAARAGGDDMAGAVSEDTTALSDSLHALIEARVWEKKSR